MLKKLNMIFVKYVHLINILFTSKTENVKFLTSLPQAVLQDMKKSFEGAHWDAKNY